MNVARTLLASLAVALATTGCSRGQKSVAYPVTDKDREIAMQHAGVNFAAPQYPVTDKDREMAMKYPGSYLGEGLIPLCGRTATLGEGAFDSTK